jgi:hypothetical protein
MDGEIFIVSIVSDGWTQFANATQNLLEIDNKYGRIKGMICGNIRTWEGNCQIHLLKEIHICTRLRSWCCESIQILTFISQILSEIINEFSVCENFRICLPSGDCDRFVFGVMKAQGRRMYRSHAAALEPINKAIAATFVIRAWEAVSSTVLDEAGHCMRRSKKSKSKLMLFV